MDSFEEFVKKEDFIRKVFGASNSLEAIKIFQNEGSSYEPVNKKISVKDCVMALHKNEFLNFVWESDDNFVEPTNSKEKLIMRDLLDLGYIVDINEEYYDPITIYDLTFFLLRKGMLCIASEFFSTAWSCVYGVNLIWKEQKRQQRPTLVSYVEKYKDKDVNLEFMWGFMHE